MKAERKLADEQTGSMYNEKTTLMSKKQFKYVRKKGYSLIMITHDKKHEEEEKIKMKIKDEQNK